MEVEIRYYMRTRSGSELWGMRHEAWGLTGLTKQLVWVVIAVKMKAAVFKLTILQSREKEQKEMNWEDVYVHAYIYDDDDDDM